MERQRDDRVLAYHVDADDRIVFYNELWLAFARSNDGARIADDETVLHRPLWNFISDAETRHLYRLMLSRVRGGRSVAVLLRCDSPSFRRHVELRIAQARSGVVVFESEMLREEPRDYVSLLDVTRDRSISVVSICSWCKQVQVPGQGWHEVEQAIALLRLPATGEPPQLAHVCCYDCYRRILNSIG